MFALSGSPGRVIVRVKTPTDSTEQRAVAVSNQEPSAQPSVAMKTLTGGLSRKTTATGLMLSLFLSLLPGCAARHMPDWSRVQAVPFQTKTEVQPYKDDAPQGSRKIILAGTE